MSTQPTLITVPSRRAAPARILEPGPPDATRQRPPDGHYADSLTYNNAQIREPSNRRAPPPPPPGASKLTARCSVA